MDKNIEILNKYLKDSNENMSAYGKHHLLKGNYLNIEESMNSGTFVKLNKIRIIKYYLSYVLSLCIWKNEIFFNEFIKKYKNLCKHQSRLFNYDLIIHAIVLKILKKREVLKNNICIIGDGKANFVHGLLDLNNINNIYSINLPQALIQDYLILKKYKSIDEKLIKVVDNENDLKEKGKKVFLIPAKNKNFLTSKNVNLFVNMASFQEMPLSETHKYIEIALSNSAYLYSLNKEEKIMYDNTKIKYADFRLGDHGRVIFEEEAKFVKYYYNSKFPFIHQKDGKLINTLVKF